MPAGITHLDHPVIAVADMPNSRETYERLGFTIPPLGAHLEWGTGNWCIMFADDYLELRGIVDGSRYTHHLDKFLESRGEGLMGVAFGTHDAQRSFELAQQSGLAPIQVKELTRRFALPEGDAFPKFRIVYLSETDAPGLLTTVICGHLTPEIIRRPEWLEHANGVVSVTSTTSVVADPSALADTYRRLVGEDAVTDIPGGIRVSPPKGAVLDFIDLATGIRHGLVTDAEVLPCIPAMSLKVGAVSRTAQVLKANGVPFVEADGALLVSPEQTCGFHLSFAE